jgi:hypothetical protein
MNLRRALYWAGIVVGFTLFAYQFWLAAEAMRTQPVALVSPLSLGAGLGAELVAYLLLMAGWALIMRLLGVRMGALPVLRGYLLSFLPRYIPGTVWGYFGRNEWLAREHGVAYRQSSTGSILEVIMLVATCGALVAGWLFPGWAGLLAAVALLAAAAVATVLVVRRLAGGDSSQLDSTGIAWLTWTAVAVIHLGFWAMHGLATGLVAAAIGAGGGVSLWSFTASFAASWLAGFLAVFVPAGLGVREWVLGELLGRSGAFAPGEPSLIAVLGRFLMVLAELLLLGLGLALMVSQRRQLPKGG